MRVLFLGDIVGRAARHAVIEHVPQLRTELSLDFIVVNCENAAGGFGVTPSICDELFACGIDVLTTGNHVWDKREIIPSVILTPMLAFDSSCWRLGYGGGFYDRTLFGLRAAGRHVVALGIAYDGQVVDKVPTGPFDMRLDGVLTPSGLRSGG